jgi:hypothetical protein
MFEFVRTMWKLCIRNAEVGLSKKNNKLKLALRIALEKGEKRNCAISQGAVRSLQTHAQYSTQEDAFY